MKTAICSLGIGVSGQNSGGLNWQPVVIPSLNSSSTQSPYGSSGVGGQVTSPKYPVQAGGTKSEPRTPFSMKTAIWALGMLWFGQYSSGLAWQPAVMPS